MLTETLQRLEQLDGMDSTLFGRQLLSFGRLLLDRGWIAAIGYFSHIDVEVMDDIFEEVEVTVDEAAGRYTYPHPFRRKVILSGSLHEVTRYRFQREPFFDHLATLLGIEPRFASRRRCLLEHHLWYLGDLRVGNRHAFAPVFFGRRLKEVPAEQITSALSDPAFGTGGVVLALKDPKLALPNGHQVRAVADLLVVEDGVEQFDLPVLERILVSRRAAPESAEGRMGLPGRRLRRGHLRPAAHHAPQGVLRLLRPRRGRVLDRHRALKTAAPARCVVISGPIG